jgi:hypothetical protein
MAISLSSEQIREFRSLWVSDQRFVCTAAVKMPTADRGRWSSRLWFMFGNPVPALCSSQDMGPSEWGANARSSPLADSKGEFRLNRDLDLEVCVNGCSSWFLNDAIDRLHVECGFAGSQFSRLGFEKFAGRNIERFPSVLSSKSASALVISPLDAQTLNEATPSHLLSVSFNRSSQ